MVDSGIQAELVEQLSRLPLPLQRRVLDYARSLAVSPPVPRGIPPSELRKFFGTISPEDGKAMIDAIEAGCEQVDPNEW